MQWLRSHLCVRLCVSQVGLAVDDTKAIQEQAQIQRLSQQVCVWWGPLVLDVRGSMHVCIHAYMPVYMCIYSACVKYQLITSLIFTPFQINLTLEAEELFPTVIRRRFVTRTKVVYPNRRGLSKRFADAWGADRWDLVDNIRKHTQQELVGG